MRVLTSNATNEWYTPPWIIERARATMGGIDLDPASDPIAQAWINATHYYTADDNALMHVWRGRVWLNPPFDDTPRWIRLLCSYYAASDVPMAMALVNSAPGYAWWEELWRFAPVVMLRDRVHFIRPDGTTIGAAKKGQTIAAFGIAPDVLRANWGDVGRVIEP